MGRPILTTRIGSNLEATEGGVCVRMVAPADIAALATALTEMLSAPQAAAELGAKGRSRFLGQYTEPIMLDRYRNLYREMLEG